MKFGLINPKRKTVLIVDAKNLDAALARAGLKMGAVDHAVVAPGLGIIVHEYALLIPPRQQRYFTLLASASYTRQLYGGNAVLYAFDEHGETIDAHDDVPLHVTWFADAFAVEDAIDKGFIPRPTIRVNDVVTWEWQANPPPRSRMH